MTIIICLNGHYFVFFVIMMLFVLVKKRLELSRESVTFYRGGEGGGGYTPLTVLLMSVFKAMYLRPYNYYEYRFSNKDKKLLNKIYYVLKLFKNFIF